jgi:flagellar basal-body rod protein FlgG
MSDLLAIVAASMSDDMARMATISHNLANATTPGFKKDIPVSRPFVDYLQAYDQGGSEAIAAATSATTTVVDHRAGSLRYTGSALDVALEGPGFFELQGDQGPVYTRLGSFRLDASGRLMSASGLAVSGNITLTGSQPRIDQQGRIFEDDKPVGQLRVVSFERPRELQKMGNGLFLAGDAGTGSVSDSHVRQGFLENSNVVSTNEMVNVIETMRHFEANQKLIQGYDDMLDRAITRLGEF